MPSRYPSTPPGGPAARTTAPSVGPATVPSSASAAALPDFAVSVMRGVSWVQVIGPQGRVLYAGILRHGHTLTYPQRPLTVTIGDAGVVRLVVNHHARAPAGRRGAVLRLVVR